MDKFIKIAEEIYVGMEDMDWKDYEDTREETILQLAAELRNAERKSREVINIDKGIRYIFDRCTPYEAMQRMIYTLNIGSKCDATINKTKSGKHLWFEHCGCTYTVVCD